MVEKEKEEIKDRLCLEDFLELYAHLSTWERYQIRIFIRWVVFRRYLRRFVMNWLFFQLEMEEVMRSSITFIRQYVLLKEKQG